jgi:hypothetical protein
MYLVDHYRYRHWLQNEKLGDQIASRIWNLREESAVKMNIWYAGYKIIHYRSNLVIYNCVKENLALNFGGFAKWFFLNIIRQKYFTNSFLWQTLRVEYLVLSHNESLAYIEKGT